MVLKHHRMVWSTEEHVAFKDRMALDECFGGGDVGGVSISLASFISFVIPQEL